MQQDDQHRSPILTETALQDSIASLLRPLTVVVACTQLLQRQIQEDGDGTSEMAETRLAMIEAAATEMTMTLRRLEEISSEHT